MQKLCIICLLCLFSSCNWFVSKEIKTQELVNQEMKEIDWNQVDQYPLFEGCDEVAVKESQRKCFEDSLLEYFSSIINQFEFEINDPINESLYVDFVINDKGIISILEIQKNDTIDTQMPEFDGIIRQSLKSLPPIAPALKRGIPISAKFRIPIILNTK